MTHSVTIESKGKRVVRLDSQESKYAYNTSKQYEVWVSDEEGRDGTWTQQGMILAENLAETVASIIKSQA
jgi:hypothetical protein